MKWNFVSGVPGAGVPPVAITGGPDGSRVQLSLAGIGGCDAGSEWQKAVSESVQQAIAPTAEKVRVLRKQLAQADSRLAAITTALAQAKTKRDRLLVSPTVLVAEVADVEGAMSNLSTEERILKERQSALGGLIKSETEQGGRLANQAARRAVAKIKGQAAETIAVAKKAIVEAVGENLDKLVLASAVSEMLTPATAEDRLAGLNVGIWQYGQTVVDSALRSPAKTREELYASIPRTAPVRDTALIVGGSSPIQPAPSRNGPLTQRQGAMAE